MSAVAICSICNELAASSLQIIRLRTADAANGLVLEDLATIGPFAQWTMDCKLQFLGNSAYPNAASLARGRITIGLSNNAVEMYELEVQQDSLVCLSQTLCRCAQQVWYWQTDIFSFAAGPAS